MQGQSGGCDPGLGAEAASDAPPSRSGSTPCSPGTAHEAKKVKHRQKRRSVIYKITSPSGKAYVGQTGWFAQRMSKHKRCKNSGCRALKAAVRKYGWDSMRVEILVDNPPEEELDSLEIALIREHGTRAPAGYNLTDGGDINPAKEGDGAAKLKAMHASGEIKAAQRRGWAKPGVRKRASASHKKRCQEDGGRQASQGKANLKAGNATAASNSAEAKAKRAVTWEAKRAGKKQRRKPAEGMYKRQCELAGGADKLREKRREWARLRKERTFLANS